MHIEPELLSAYLDNELSDEERRTIEAHVRTCAECRRELAELQWTASLLAQLPEVREPRPFYVRRTDLEPARPRWQTWLATWRPLFRVASYAGTVVVLFLLLLDVLMTNTPSMDVSMPTAMEMETESAPVMEKAAEPAGEMAMPAEEERAVQALEAPSAAKSEEADMASTSVPTHTAEPQVASSTDQTADRTPPPHAVPPTRGVPGEQQLRLTVPRLTWLVLLLTLLTTILYLWSSRWEPHDH